MRYQHQVGRHHQGLSVGDTEEVTGGLGVEGHDKDDELPGRDRPLLDSRLTGEEDLHNVGLSSAGHPEVRVTTSLEVSQNCSDKERTGLR